MLVKLNLVIPITVIPWLAIGDLNYVLFPNEMRGEHKEGKRCSTLGNFVASSKLHDLGFKGLTFTWHRGEIFERLNIAIYNDAWIS